MIYTLTPYQRTKSNTPNEWVFECNVRSRVRRSEVARRLRSMYPDLQIKKIHVIKSIKRTLMVVTTTVQAPWND